MPQHLFEMAAGQKARGNRNITGGAAVAALAPAAPAAAIRVAVG